MRARCFDNGRQGGFTRSNGVVIYAEVEVSACCGGTLLEGGRVTGCKEHVSQQPWPISRSQAGAARESKYLGSA